VGRGHGTYSHIVSNNLTQVVPYPRESPLCSYPHKLALRCHKKSPQLRNAPICTAYSQQGVCAPHLLSCCAARSRRQHTLPRRTTRRALAPFRPRHRSSRRAARPTCLRHALATAQGHLAPACLFFEAWVGWANWKESMCFG
jgi:hypothetical protein